MDVIQQRVTKKELDFVLRKQLRISSLLSKELIEKICNYKTVGVENNTVFFVDNPETVELN